METKSLTLVANTPDRLRTLLADPQLYEQRFATKLAEGLHNMMTSGEVSPEFLAQLRAAKSPDPWQHGFALVHKEDNVVMGAAGFKGPPNPEGVVEIAYGIAPGYQGKGYATEAAQALIAYAIESGCVRILRAHTLPAVNGSTRVLEKCGFKRLGEVVDPEDGLVWRWERSAGNTPATE